MFYKNRYIIKSFGDMDKDFFSWHKQIHITASYYKFRSVFSTSEYKATIECIDEIYIGIKIHTFT